MTFTSRRAVLVVLLVAVAFAVFAQASCDANCASCVYGICTSCKSGYYYSGKGCTSCLSAHCAHCEAVGWCVSCESGYRLQYVSNSDNLTVNQYGKCVNGASTVGAHATLVAVMAALAYAVIA